MQNMRMQKRAICGAIALLLAGGAQAQSTLAGGTLAGGTFTTVDTLETTGAVTVGGDLTVNNGSSIFFNNNNSFLENNGLTVSDGGANSVTLNALNGTVSCIRAGQRRCLVGH